MSQPPLETYPSGTVLTVGSHKARIIKYLTSGGFAHIYSAEISPPDPNSSSIACLKRVLVPDKPSLNSLRAEVDAMKLLKAHKFVVSYIDSHAAKSSLNNGSYEVFLLMEYCARGGLIDFMNTRLQNRLKEFEVLKIMSQVSQGVAAMHALQPPLIHRDIKIENVLISEDGDFKVCDFGSVCGVIRPPKNPQELNYVQHDILKNTTAQYRSPEMIDLYRGLPVDEKSDIWALGVFLYKLCYYTTPFEKAGEVAILHSKFQFPAYPQYSDQLKNLISALLRENPMQRPNICQLLAEVSRIQGVPCPVKNFYLERTMLLQQQQQQQHQQLQPLRHSVSQPQMEAITLPVTLQPHPQKVLASAQVSYANTGLTASPTAQQKLLYSRSQPLPARNDPFLNLDKSNLLPPKTKLEFPELKYNKEQLNGIPSTTPYATQGRSVSPVRNGRGDISKILKSNPTSVDRLSSYVDSETQTFETIEPLSRSVSRSVSRGSASSASSQDSVEEQSTGGSFTRRIGDKLKRIISNEPRNTSPIRSRQNTGGSTRSAFSTLRRGTSSNFGSDRSKRNSVDFSVRRLGSSGNKVRVSSSKSIEEKGNTNKFENKGHNRSVSTSSMTSDLNKYEGKAGSVSRGYNQAHSPIKMSANRESRNSIQKRVHDLLKNSQDSPVRKTAPDFGEFSSFPQDHAADHTISDKVINVHNVTSSPVVQKATLDTRHQSNTVVSPTRKHFTRTREKPVPPPKPARLRPKPPPKPFHLKVKNLVMPKKGRYSNKANTLSDEVDIDDLEEDFKKRYPSAI